MKIAALIQSSWWEVIHSLLRILIFRVQFPFSDNVNRQLLHLQIAKCVRKWARRTCWNWYCLIVQDPISSECKSNSFHNSAQDPQKSIITFLGVTHRMDCGSNKMTTRQTNNFVNIVDMETNIILLKCGTFLRMLVKPKNQRN